MSSWLVYLQTNYIFVNMPTEYVLLRYIYLCNYARLYKVLCIFSEHSPGTDDECTIAAIADGPWILVLGPWSLDLIGSWSLSEELPWSHWGWCDIKGTEAWPAVGVLNNNLILTIRIKEEKEKRDNVSKEAVWNKIVLHPLKIKQEKRDKFCVKDQELLSQHQDQGQNVKKKDKVTKESF